MDKVLIVCSSQKGLKIYIDSLKEMGYVHIDTEVNGAAARRRLLVEEYNLVLIDTPLKDEYGHEFAKKIAHTGATGVVLMVKSENADLLSGKLEEYGIFVISKPFSKVIFSQGIKFVFASIRRFKVLKKEQDKLLKKVEDIKIIDRAKCLLIEYTKITEKEAHRLIEKRAMDERVTRREVSEKIIEYYEV